MTSSEYTWMIIIILLLLLLCTFAGKLKYYCKFGIYTLTCAMASIILLPLGMMRPKNVKNLLFLSRFCRAVSPIIGIEWIVNGQENLSKDESYVIMANHQSSLDILGMFHVWPLLSKGTAVAKEELKFAWPFGLFLWLAGVIFIPRSKGEKSKQILNSELQLRKENKVKIWIFPEGTRSSDGKIHNFKKGGFHMALSAKIPILPIVYSYYYFLDHENKHFDNGKVIITILPPVNTDGYSLDDMDDLVSIVREKMVETFEETSNME